MCRWDTVAASIPVELLLQSRGIVKGMNSAVQFYQRRLEAAQVGMIDVSRVAWLHWMYGWVLNNLPKFDWHFE